MSDEHGGQYIPVQLHCAQLWTVHGIGVPGFVYGAVVKGMLISKPCGNLGRDDLCGDIYIWVCMS